MAKPSIRSGFCAPGFGSARARTMIPEKGSRSKTDRQLIHILDGAGIRAEGALRQRRGHEFVEVAVEHA
jgi:hypothetical protein